MASSVLEGSPVMLESARGTLTHTPGTSPPPSTTKRIHTFSHSGTQHKLTLNVKSNNYYTWMGQRNNLYCWILSGSNNIFLVGGKGDEDEFLWNRELTARIKPYYSWPKTRTLVRLALARAIEPSCLLGDFVAHPYGHHCQWQCSSSLLHRSATICPWCFTNIIFTHYNDPER